MNRTAPSYRGQPLLALIVLLGGWVAVRAMVWDAGAIAVTAPAAAAAADLPKSGGIAQQAREPMPLYGLPRDPVDPPFTTGPAPGRLTSNPGRQPLTGSLAASRPAPISASALFRAVPLGAARVSHRISSAHQLLWMTALARLPLPRSLFAAPGTAGPAGAPALAPALASAAAPHRDARWSADGWLLLRGGEGAPLTGGLSPATYGGSQAGAVLRYRLATASAHRPAVYLRGSAALNGSHEREAALGVSARPFARIPLVAAAEARINSQPGGTHLRPAAFVHTELPWMALPYGARAELYAQAGYVGGDFATAFADGQLRVDRRVARVGRGELRAGGGVWGGAQKGASRLDVGPSATLGVPISGTASARVAVDWRFRVTGNAAPASGPALTLSAGF